MKRTKKLVALILSIVLLTSLIPANTFASLIEERQEEPFLLEDDTLSMEEAEGSPEEIEQDRESVDKSTDQATNLEGIGSEENNEEMPDESVCEEELGNEAFEEETETPSEEETEGYFESPDEENSELTDEDGSALQAEESFEEQEKSSEAEKDINEKDDGLLPTAKGEEKSAEAPPETYDFENALTVTFDQEATLQTYENEDVFHVCKFSPEENGSFYFYSSELPDEVHFFNQSYEEVYPDVEIAGTDGATFYWGFDSGMVGENCYFVSRLANSEADSYNVGVEEEIEVTFDANGGFFNGEPSYTIARIKGISRGGFYPQKNAQMDASLVPLYEAMDDHMDKPPEREGYFFKGWARKADAINTIVNYGFKVTESITLYAVWGEAVELTYDANGGHFSSSNETIDVVVYAKEGNINYSPPDPEREGYVFKGWAETANATSTVALYHQKVLEPSTFYAIWGRAIQVTYDANGGFYNGDKEVTRFFENTPLGETIHYEGYWSDFHSPERDGYSCIGWARTAEDTEPVDLYSLVITEPITLYAIWKESVEVTFDANGGSLDFGDTKEKTYNMEFLRGSSLYDPLIWIYKEKKRYVFSGWAETPNATKPIDLDSIKAVAPVTLYAVWKKAAEITFDANGGYFNGNVPDISFPVTDGSKIGQDFFNNIYVEPEREGYALKGWGLSDNAAEPINIYDLKVNKTITLYAIWGKAVEIILDANGGCFNGNPNETVMIDIVPENGESPLLYDHSQQASRDGYDLMGWARKATDTVPLNLALLRISKPITLYAVWSKKIEIIFDANGGYFDDNPSKKLETVYVPQNDDIGTYDIYDPPGWKGYSFKGWARKADASEPIDLYNFRATEPITFYAVWEKTVEISFDANGGCFYDIPGHAVETIKMGIGEWLGSNTVQNPTRNRYGFIGWALKADSSERLNLNEIKAKTPITLYAVWKKLEQTKEVESPPDYMGLQTAKKTIQTLWEQGTLTEHVKVAVIDTAVNTSHELFRGRLLPEPQSKSFINDGNAGKTHGTHVAGIIAENTTGLVDLMILPALNEEGKGTLENVINAIRYAVNQHADIINLSISTKRSDFESSDEYDNYAALLGDAIKEAKDNDCVVIVSAGNNGIDIEKNGVIPAIIEDAITVGGLQNGNRTRFPASNYGKAVDVWAPGADIKSAASEGESSYQTMTGTSMAAAHIAAFLANIKTLNPEISFEELVAFLHNRDEFNVPEFTDGLLSEIGEPDRFTPKIVDLNRTKEAIVLTCSVPRGFQCDVYRSEEYYEFEKIGKTSGSIFIDESIDADKMYTYYLKAIGVTGNQSEEYESRPIEANDVYIIPESDRVIIRKDKIRQINIDTMPSNLELEGSWFGAYGTITYSIQEDHSVTIHGVREGTGVLELRDKNSMAVARISVEVTEENDIAIEEKCGPNAYWSLSEDRKTLKINGIGPIYGIPWLPYHDTIEKVIIGNQITSIGDYAFAEMYNLSSVEGMQGVLSIGAFAFQNAGQNSEVECTLPVGLEEIGYGAFSGASFKKLTVPSSVERIRGRAFENLNCPGLDVAEDNKYYIIKDSFLIDKSRSELLECFDRSIQKCIIPDGVKVIGDAFKGCNEIRSVYFPKSLCELESGRLSLFSDCDLLTDVYFSGFTQDYKKLCAHLKDHNLSGVRVHINVEGGDSQFHWKVEGLSGNLTLIIDGKGDAPAYDRPSQVPWYKGRDEISSVLVQKGVKEIPAYAFYREENIKDISLPSSVNDYGMKALLGTTCISAFEFVSVQSGEAMYITPEYLLANYEPNMVYEPEVFIRDEEGRTLQKDSDYAVQYDLPSGTGQGLIQIVFTGQYEDFGKVCLPFVITADKFEADKCRKITSVTVHGNNFVYTGTVISPEITVYSNMDTVKKIYYTLSFSPNHECRDVGEYIVTVKGRGGYTGEAQAKFSIVPGNNQRKEDRSASPKTPEPNGKDVEQNATDSSGSKAKGRQKKEKNVSIEKMPGETQKAAVDTAHVSEKNYNPDPDQADISTRTPMLAQQVFSFNGDAYKPSVLLNGLKEGTDYKVEYRRNCEIGKASAIVYGIGDYKGSLEMHFMIIDSGKIKSI